MKRLKKVKQLTATSTSRTIDVLFARVFAKKKLGDRKNKINLQKFKPINN